MTPHSSSILFFSSTSSSTVILPSVSSTFSVSVAITPAPPASRFRWSLRLVFVVLASALRLVAARVSLAPRSARLGSARRSGLRLGSGLLGSAAARPRLRLGGAASDASPCSSSCSIRASISPTRSRSGAVNRPTTVVSGADDRAEHLRPQHVGRRQLGEALDLVGADRCALEHAAPDREDLRVSCAASSSAFATATGSPSDSTNAIAVGPSSSASSASARRPRPRGA